MPDSSGQGAMIAAAALWPMVAMVFLTFGVWAMLFVRRIPKLTSDPVPIDLFKIRATRPMLSPKEMAANDNLMNLFELPVLFYALCLALAATGYQDGLFVVGSWAYVGLRLVHSVVHCTFNHVALRFAAYLGSTLVLAGLWLAFSVRLAGWT